MTTALLGNCGVTFAPCKASDRDFLAGMMEAVEDIPKNAILSGLPWNWESYGDYLDTLEALEPSINLCGLAGHSATRVYVMGERAIEEAATDDEIDQIAELAGRSVKEGAVGFSVNRLPAHQLPDGRCIPGTLAHRDELRAIARAVGAQGGIMQTVTDFGEFDEEMDLIGDYARLSRGALFSSALEMDWKRIDERVTALRADGLSINSVTVPRGGGHVGGLSTTRLFNTPAWTELRELDLDARLAAIRDPEKRRRLIDEGKQPSKDRRFGTKNWFYMGSSERPCYTNTESLYAVAQAAGEHPLETYFRLADESDGRALFHIRGFNHDLESVGKLLATEWAQPGLGDAGAHVSQMIDAGWPTFVLSYWHRERGLYSLQEAVRRISAVPADVLGFEDRGTLAVGKRADINVFDIESLEERMPQMVSDFPFGAPRFIQRAAGYKATLCNGQLVLRDDELTGARPGQVLRSN